LKSGSLASAAQSAGVGVFGVTPCANASEPAAAASATAPNPMRVLRVLLIGFLLVV
jgi:hypothetical protein